MIKLSYIVNSWVNSNKYVVSIAQVVKVYPLVSANYTSYTLSARSATMVPTCPMVNFSSGRSVIRATTSNNFRSLSIAELVSISATIFRAVSPVVFAKSIPVLLLNLSGSFLSFPDQLSGLPVPLSSSPDEVSEFLVLSLNSSNCCLSR